MTKPEDVVREALTRWVYPEQNASDPEVQANLDALSTIEAELDKRGRIIEKLENESLTVTSARLRAERQEWEALADRACRERDECQEQLAETLYLYEKVRAERDEAVAALREAEGAMSSLNVAISAALSRLSTPKEPTDE